MSRLLRQPLLFLCLGLISAALPAAAQDLQSTQAPPQDPSSGSSTRVLPVVPITHRGVPWRDPEAGPVGFAAPAGAHLSYFGGPVISNVQVVEVLYGTGSGPTTRTLPEPPSRPSATSTVTSPAATAGSPNC